MPRNRGISVALLIVLGGLAVACGQPAGARSTASVSPPPGYRAYDGGQIGFHAALPSDWQQAGEKQADGVSFTDPTGRAALLIHVEPARSSDLATATGAVMFDLTGGGGATGARESTTTLAGQPARRVQGTFAAAGASQSIEAVVSLRSNRAWVLALAGTPDRVKADQPDFDRIQTSFTL